MPSNHLILCHSLLLLPSIFPSIRVFSNEPALCFRWPKYWSFSFNITLSNEPPGLISFRMDWLGSPYSPRDSQESSPTLIQKHHFCAQLSFFFFSLIKFLFIYFYISILFFFQFIFIKEANYFTIL